MSLVLTVGPAQEPILLEEAKQQCKLEEDFDDDNDYVESLITVAREHVEDYTGRSLLTQTWRLTLDRFPSCGEIPLDRPNVATVTSVKYIDPNGVEQTLSSTTLYSVDTDAFPGRVLLRYGQVWPSTRCQRNAVTIVFTCGYGDEPVDVPTPILAAMKLLIGTWYENRESVVIGTIVNDLPDGVERLLYPYRFMEAA
jgi:uncharacterized phiE125 gp8 family phage protein